MKKALFAIGAAFTAILVIAADAPTKSDSAALQGTWKGTAVTPAEPGTATLTITGTNLEFHGPDSNEWYKATFTLREDQNPKQLIAVVTDCPAPPYIGKTSYAIYALEGKSLRLTGNEPGETNFPAAFAAPGARQFLFNR